MCVCIHKPNVTVSNASMHMQLAYVYNCSHMYTVYLQTNIFFSSRKLNAWVYTNYSHYIVTLICCSFETSCSGCHTTWTSEAECTLYPLTSPTSVRLHCGCGLHIQ